MRNFDLHIENVIHQNNNSGNSLAWLICLSKVLLVKIQKNHTQNHPEPPSFSLHSDPLPSCSFFLPDPPGFPIFILEENLRPDYKTRRAAHSLLLLLMNDLKADTVPDSVDFQHIYLIYTIYFLFTLLQDLRDESGDGAIIWVVIVFVRTFNHF